VKSKKVKKFEESKRDGEKKGKQESEERRRKKSVGELQ